jgi:hypothetical protein
MVYQTPARRATNELLRWTAKANLYHGKTTTSQETHSTLMTWLKTGHEKLRNSMRPRSQRTTGRTGSPLHAWDTLLNRALQATRELTAGSSHYSYGKRNDTYDLQRTSTQTQGAQQEGGQRPLNQNKRRMTGEGRSKQKSSKREPSWVIPGAPAPRGILNQGGRCSRNVAMQLYFHIPSITRIPELKQITAMKPNLDRYGVGDGPLVLEHLHTVCPHSEESRAQDLGEILTLILSATPLAQPARLPVVALLTGRWQ